MTTPTKLHSFRPWLWAGVALTLLKIWLTRGQPLFAIGGATHDDRLFIELTGHLLNGEWLGAYDQLTLAKGPFFSIFMAANFWLGLPLGLTQQIAYAIACAVLVYALRPWLRQGVFALLAYSLLLWNPMSFEGANLSRLLRQNVATPLALLVLAGLIALYARRHERFRRQAPWAALAGAAFGCFWLTREEAIWLLPGVGVLGLAYLWELPRLWRERGVASLGTIGVALFTATLPIGAVCTLNAHYYGWFGTVEFRAPEFKDAYGALLRVQVGPEIPYVPITRQMREAIYPLSPAFAELKPYLEGGIGTHWSDKENFSGSERQIRGGWAMWALRDSVAAAGHAQSASEALAFYRRLADEINSACDLGLLPARPPRSGFFPPMTPEYFRRLRSDGWAFARYFAQFESFTTRTPGSEGDYAELKIFRDLTRDRLSRAARSPEPPVPGQDRINRLKLSALENIGHGLAALLFWLVPAAHLAAFVRLVECLPDRRVTFPFVLAVAAWLACAADVVINLLVHVTSFDNMTPTVFASAYPVLLLFVIGVFLDSATYLKNHHLPWRAGLALLAMTAVLFYLFRPAPVPASGKRNLWIEASPAIAPGAEFKVSFNASTATGRGEQVGFLHAEVSRDGGKTWSPLYYLDSSGPTVSRQCTLTAGPAGTTLLLRVRAAYRGGPAGDVDYLGTTIQWHDSWANWGQPPAKVFVVEVTTN